MKRNKKHTYYQFIMKGIHFTVQVSGGSYQRFNLRRGRRINAVPVTNPVQTEIVCN